MEQLFEKDKMTHSPISLGHFFEDEIFYKKIGILHIIPKVLYTFERMRTIK